MMQPNPTPSPKCDMSRSCDKFHVLVGVTGSVAALKLPLLVHQLFEIPAVDVRVVTTEHAQHFYNPEEVPVTVYSDKDEWELWKQRSDPVLHIELRRWADLFVIAPLDANTLGKIASGICDNLLTCVVRAWDTSRPLLFCPAMNTAMWQHPITAKQVASLKDFGYVEIPCIAKKLVCGDEGKGAMAEVLTIVDAVKQYRQKSQRRLGPSIAECSTECSGQTSCELSWLVEGPCRFVGRKNNIKRLLFDMFNGCWQDSSLTDSLVMS